MKDLIHKLQLEIEACNREILKDDSSEKHRAFHEGKAMGLAQAIVLIKAQYV
jgi:hypothetical protein